MSARRRAVAAEEARSVVGAGRDLDVLASIAWAGVLSTSQVERLHFPSRRRAQRRLRALLDHGLVRAHLQGEALQRENVYTASPLGIERLVEADFFPRGAPQAARAPRLQHMAHVLAVREVFVALVLCERSGALELREILFDSELRGDAVLKAAKLIPDALVTVVRDGTEVLVGVEVDLATETTTTLRAKFEVWHRVLTTRSDGWPFDRAQLLVVVPTESRARTLEKILAGAQLAGRSTVVRLDMLAAIVSSLFGKGDGWGGAVNAAGEGSFRALPARR